jgi:hypothetical protein
VEYPDYPSIGRFEAKEFKADGWKPEYPNPAFLKLTDDDAYWAAKIVMSFTDEQIRAITKTGQLSDPNAEEYLVQTLIERRDKIGRHWLTRVNSFDRFEMTSGGDLKFQHLASLYGFAREPEYDIRRYSVDDTIEAAEITSEQGTVTVYIRNTSGHRAIVGIERQSKNVGTLQ